MRQFKVAVFFIFVLAPQPFGGVFGELVSTGVAVGSAFIISGFLAGYDHFKCKFYECCTDHWIVRNFTGLEHALRSRLYGQHLVLDTVVKALRAHMNNPEPRKALVLSFHGWTGGGKNYVSKMISEYVYRKSSDSHYVHLFVSSLHFAHAELVDEYKKNLHNWIRGNVTLCPRSLFIFDELDKIASGVLDAIKPFLDFHEKVDGVDFRKSTFIFLSNTAGNDITRRTLDHWQRGKAREELPLVDMEKIIHSAAFNEPGGLHFSQLISHHLIDHFVPFLPLEREHVKRCIQDDFVSKGYSPTASQIQEVADMLQYFPENGEVFSKSGCKKVTQKVNLVIEDKGPIRTEL